jgi:hypothetical protein
MAVKQEGVNTKLRGCIKLAGKIKLGMADGVTRNALPRQAINKRVTILEPSRIYWGTIMEPSWNHHGTS